MNLKDILYQVNNLPKDCFETYWELWHNDPEFLKALQDHLDLYSTPKGFNRRIEGYLPFTEDTENMFWTEDNNTYHYGGNLVGLHPKFAGLYAKSITSGYETKVEYLTFKLTNGFRGIDIDSIIAFDSTGRGCLFIKR